LKKQEPSAKEDTNMKTNRSRRIVNVALAAVVVAVSVSGAWSQSVGSAASGVAQTAGAASAASVTSRLGVVPNIGLTVAPLGAGVLAPSAALQPAVAAVPALQPAAAIPAAAAAVQADLPPNAAAPAAAPAIAPLAAASGRMAETLGRQESNDDASAAAERFNRLADGSAERRGAAGSVEAVAGVSSSRAYPLTRRQALGVAAVAVPALAWAAKAHAAVSVPAAAASASAMLPAAAVTGALGTAYLTYRRLAGNWTLYRQGKALKNGSAAEVMMALRAPERSMRIQGAEAAAVRPDARSFVPALVAAAADLETDRDSRLAAVTALGKIDPAGVSEDLIAIAETDPSAAVRFTAMNAALSGGGDKAIELVRAGVLEEAETAQRTGNWTFARLAAAVVATAQFGESGRGAARRLLLDPKVGAASSAVFSTAIAQHKAEAAWNSSTGATMGEVGFWAFILGGEASLFIIGLAAAAGVFFGLYKAGRWLLTKKDAGAKYAAMPEELFSTNRLQEAAALVGGRR